MDLPKHPSNQNLALFLVLLGAGGAAIHISLPQHRRERRWSNERSAAAALKTIAMAEADYRANDRDGNGINDFWTGDVAELGRMGLIERGVAEADTLPLGSLGSTSIPFNGYHFTALQLDNSLVPPESYRQDTDKTSRKVHHFSRFGFVAYPAEPGVTGNFIYIINQDNSVLRCPAAGNPPPKDWPNDAELQKSWSKFQ